MSRHLTRPSPYINHILIDLTLSDDDEDDIHSHKPPQPSSIPSPAIDQLPAAGDVSRKPSSVFVTRDESGRRSYPPILPPGTGSQTTIQLPRIKQSLPGPVEQKPPSSPIAPSTRPAQKRAATILPHTEQAAKRPRLESTEILSPASSRFSSSSPNKVAQRQQKSNPLVVYPVHNGPNGDGSRTYQPSPIRPTPTGNIRPRIKGDSSHPQIILPASKPSNPAQINIKAVADRVGSFITTYISPLLKQVLGDIRTKINDKHGHHVAKYVHSQLLDNSSPIIKGLIEDPRFFAEHQAHNWDRLSSSYQKRLSGQVYKVFDDRSTEFVVKALQDAQQDGNSYTASASSKDESPGSHSEDYSSVRTRSRGQHNMGIQTPSIPNSQKSYSSSCTTRASLKPSNSSNPSLELKIMRIVGFHPEVSRPYMDFTTRDLIRQGLNSDRARRLLSKHKTHIGDNLIHVDLCREEIAEILQLLPIKSRFSKHESTLGIVTVMRGQESRISEFASIINRKLKTPGPGISKQLLRERGPKAITAFLQDAAADLLNLAPQILRIQARDSVKPIVRSPITSLLREREIGGRTSARFSRGLRSFKDVVRNELEDSLALVERWTDCCGDIFSLSWTNEQAFICGATAHSDFHNMQYNKPGNLSVGSTSSRTLKAIPNHRIVRPTISSVENAQNALDSMRRTQDPWLYTSVVSTAYSATTGYSFTASFDKTVKVWSVETEGAAMVLEGTWAHEAKVNFVVTSAYHRLVATSADVSNNAIRVYHLDEDDIARARYDTYTGERADEQADELLRNDTWAYFPAAIQWGRLERVSHLLLVGYSPRSLSGDDNDIPGDKSNTGELCMWNTLDGSKVSISAARTQNVFEVIWHPTQPMFFAATSPCGIFAPDSRTQIQVFAQNESGSFILLKSLDCPACDINELTVLPNSIAQAYVTASCTDGKTYVWDTSQGDHAIHVLEHGEPIETPIHDLPREVTDAGVKFAAWGKSLNRFYTGSSDGELKVWNIKAPRGEAYLQTILSIPAGISVGVFSKDFSKLILGDSTGTVHLLSVDQTSEDEDGIEPLHSNATVKDHRFRPPKNLSQYPPKVLIHHPEPEPPCGYQASDTEDTAVEIARKYLDSEELIINPVPTIGAVQGPQYHNTNLFRLECHQEGDANAPLLLDWQAKQHINKLEGVEEIPSEFPCLPRVESSSRSLHTKNVDLDFDLSRLSISNKEALLKEGIDFDFSDENMYEYKRIRPHFSLFKEVAGTTTRRVKSKVSDNKTSF
ncbi:WD repeat domain-containing protein [Phlyctema vagabunda]|uniref:WD repeat domain-containing protein n=1 Tax=Phlyctema vagabunda TaxID=108571 RepID=A0ABR4PW06_9HELO